MMDFLSLIIGLFLFASFLSIIYISIFWVIGGIKDLIIGEKEEETEKEDSFSVKFVRFSFLFFGMLMVGAAFSEEKWGQCIFGGVIFLMAYKSIKEKCDSEGKLSGLILLLLLGIIIVIGAFSEEEFGLAILGGVLVLMGIKLIGKKDTKKQEDAYSSQSANEYNVDASEENEKVEKPKERTTIRCPSCNALNTVIVGEVCYCEFCGNPIKESK